MAQPSEALVPLYWQSFLCWSPLAVQQPQQLLPPVCECASTSQAAVLVKICNLIQLPAYICAESQAAVSLDAIICHILHKIVRTSTAATRPRNATSPPPPNEQRAQSHVQLSLCWIRSINQTVLILCWIRSKQTALIIVLKQTVLSIRQL